MKCLRPFALILSALIFSMLVETSALPLSPYDTSIAPVVETTKAGPQGFLHFNIDPGASKFMAIAHRGGLLAFEGKNHHIAIRDFSGMVELVPSVVSPAALQFTVQAASLVETSDDFTEPQKQIIDKELRETVLETAKYPEIKFESTVVTISSINGGQFQASISGELTLHGSSRHIVIEANVTLNNDGLRAVGEFSVHRSDFNITATSKAHGMVRVDDKITFTFDIMARAA